MERRVGLSRNRQTKSCSCPGELADDKTVDAAALEALGVRLRTPLRAGLARQVAWAAAGANANDVFRCPLAFIK